MTVVLIDNYDSFTFNLFHYLGGLGAQVAVYRNDKIKVAEVIAADPEAIVLSPGPCTPNEAGICLELIEQACPRIPIFGVCLGHQAIGQAFGGEVVRAPLPVHGKLSLIKHKGEGRLVMGLKHCELPVHGVQFHPESIASEHGHLILKNFLDIAAAWNAACGRRTPRRAPGRSRAAGRGRA